MPLQLLWDPRNGILSLLPADFPPQVMCRVFMVVSLGVCQPLLLFLAAALCRFAITCERGREAGVGTLRCGPRAPAGASALCACVAVRLQAPVPCSVPLTTPPALPAPILDCCSGGLGGKGATWRAPLRQAALLMLPFAGLQTLAAWWDAWLEATVDERGEAGSLPFASFARIRCPRGALPLIAQRPPPGQG